MNKLVEKALSICVKNALREQTFHGRTLRLIQKQKAPLHRTLMAHRGTHRQRAVLRHLIKIIEKRAYLSILFVSSPYRSLRKWLLFLLWDKAILLSSKPTKDVQNYSTVRL